MSTGETRNELFWPCHASLVIIKCILFFVVVVGLCCACLCVHARYNQFKTIDLLKMYVFNPPAGRVEVLLCTARMLLSGC